MIYTLYQLYRHADDTTLFRILMLYILMLKYLTTPTIIFIIIDLCYICYHNCLKPIAENEPQIDPLNIDLITIMTQEPGGHPGGHLEGPLDGQEKMTEAVKQTPTATTFGNEPRLTSENLAKYVQKNPSPDPQLQN